MFISSERKVISMTKDNNREIIYVKSQWCKSKTIEAETRTGTTILFADNSNMSSQSIEVLQSMMNVIVVNPEREYMRSASTHYGIDPNVIDDYHRLIEDIKQNNIRVDSVVFSWGFGKELDPLKIENEGPIYEWYYIVKAFHDLNQPLPDRILFLLDSCAPNATIHRSLAGYCKSMEMLYPKTKCSCVYCDNLDEPEIIYQELITPPNNNIYEVKYEEGIRYVKRFAQVFIPKNKQGIKRKGSYLVTGALGGIGRHLCSFLVENYQANLLLIGRSQLDEDGEEFIERLQAKNVSVMYSVADVTDMNSVKSAVNIAKKSGLYLNGIFHLAGSASKVPLFLKSSFEVDACLSTKIKGTMATDLATRNEPIDFFCAFSSTSSLIGDFGQGDYAVASRFLDEYVQYRSYCGARGKSISINWPLWQLGGMHLDSGGEKLYLKTSGIDYLSNDAGFEALERILTSEESNIAVFCGNVSSLNKILQIHNDNHNTNTVDESQESSISNDIITNQRGDIMPLTSSNASNEDLINDILKIAANTIQAKATALDVDENIGDFGFDSISLREYANAISSTYGIEVSPTIFFAKSTIRDVSEYLYENFQAEIELYYTKAIDTRPLESNIDNMADTEMSDGFTPLSELMIKKTVTKSQSSNKYSNQDVAIIGISFQLPSASTQKELWDVLEHKKDVIREIPSNRWNWQDYYSINSREANKTNSRWGGFIDDVDCFDAEFFRISPREAELIDPQHRLYIENVWKAIEDSGYKPSDLAGKKIGVFSGMQFTDYQQLLSQTQDKIQAQASIGNSPALLSNRVSFIYNFNGPSESIDTACSSSLVALHRAVKSIQNGESEIAIAGGVSLMLDPNTYVGAGVMGVFSPDGRCKTFDESANGYVKGEGVTVLLLKPYEKAVKDGDNIYGAIVGSAENHGGRANSLTAPNSDSQAQLIIDAFNDSGIDPYCISYIETHGTGTKLGDPVEVEGLQKAFHTLYSKWNHNDYTNKRIALGAFKSNIGHLEPASGIAGVIKVLLSFRNKRLPGIVHLKKENEYLNLDNSPFYLLHDTIDWSVSRPEKGHDNRRYAGVSSFGFGGANAHVIVREHNTITPVEFNEPNEEAIILSAKTNEQLIEYAKKMLNVCNADNRFLDTAYTLQTGRSEMECRLAIMASNYTDLSDKLVAYLSGSHVKGVYSSHHIEPSEIVNEAHRRAYLWCKGKPVDWTSRWDEMDRKKTSLPVYPFKKSRYWLPKLLKETKSELTVLSSVMEHKDIDGNEHKFEMYFTGSEFFIMDHNHVLPGVAYLEIIKNAIESIANYHGYIEIKSLVWKVPVIIRENGKKINISVKPKNNKYEIIIYSEVEGDRVEHAFGIASPLDESHCMRGTKIECVFPCDSTSREEAEGYYHLLEGLGSGLKDRFRGIKHFSHTSKFGVSAIGLKAEEIGTLQDFTLHPTLLDAGLQSAVAYAYKENLIDSSILYVPFSIGAFYSYSTKKSPTNAYVERSQKNGLYFSIFYLDSEGNILMEIQDLYIRPIQLDAYKEIEENQISDILLGEVYWEETEIASTQDSGSLLDKHSTSELDDVLETHICTFTLETELSSSENQFFCLSTLMNDPNSSMDEIEAVFKYLKGICNLKDNINRNILCYYVSEIPIPEYDALEGLFQTVHLENGSLNGKVIHYSDGSIIRTTLQRESKSTDSRLVRYKNNKRYIKNVREIPFTKFTEPDTSHTDRTIVITGGLGGLGKLVATHLSKVLSYNVVLCGRRELEIDDKRFLSECKTNVQYYKTDISNLADVLNLKRLVEERHGGVDYLIHCAGVLSDSLLSKKEIETIHYVFGPKVLGTRNIYSVFGNNSRTKIVNFSSTTSVFGNAGQSDYAYANSYIDYLTHYKNDYEHRKDIVINWSYWKNGNMTVSAETETYLSNTYGMLPIPNQAGIEIFTSVLHADQSQLVVLYGNKQLLRRRFFQVNSSKFCVQDQPPYAEKKDMSGHKQITFSRDFTNDLALIMAGILKTDIEIVLASNNISNLGFDSITFTELANEINSHFGLEITPAIFFDYMTCSTISEAIMAENMEALSYHYIGNENARIVEEEEATDRLSANEHTLVQSNSKEPIAIIGMSGKMPFSETLEDFWDNIIAGKDLTSSIPIYRKKLSQHFDNPDLAVPIHGGFINDIDTFDPLFFEVSPLEVGRMNPQERLMMQTSWHAVENAGYRRRDLEGHRISVFVGASNADYEELQAKEHIATSATRTMLCNRISHYFAWTGPSESIDTACSSSLCAINRAVHSIWHEGCEYALAGGSNVIASTSMFKSGREMGMLSEDGKCKTFDVTADGYARAECVGAVFLKPLSKAIEDRDYVYGTICGTAVNHVGYGNTVTTPSAASQADVINRACLELGVSPKTISYIETHGTGSNLGDSVEIEGIKRAFPDVSKNQMIVLGAVKTNMGHAEAASGMPSIFKVLLAMQHKVIPPNINLEQLNPHIKTRNTRLIFPLEPHRWGNNVNIPLRAGISCFGVGGSNAHVIIESYENTDNLPQKNPNQTKFMFLISAKTQQSLNRYCNDLIQQIQRSRQEKHCSAQVSDNVEEILVSLWIKSGNNSDIAITDDFEELDCDPVKLLEFSRLVQEHFQISQEDLWPHFSCIASIKKAILHHKYSDGSGLLHGGGEVLQLYHISYTLACRRELMEERIAFVASTIDELINKLSSYVAGEDPGEQYYSVAIHNNRSDLEKDYSRYISDDIESLAMKWVSGSDIPTDRLFPERYAPYALPQYSFEKDHYWFAGENQVQESNHIDLMSLLQKIENGEVSAEEGAEQLA